MVYLPLVDRNSNQVGSLSRIWAGRYLPDFSKLISNRAENSIALLEYSSDFGRRRTVAGVRRHLRISCELAGLEVNQIFSGSSNLVSLSKVRHLAKSVAAVYEKILDFYEQRSQIHTEDWHPTKTWIPTIEALSSELQPALSEMQAQHLADEDPRTIGFVTTQLHYSTQAIVQRLAPMEKALLSCYFQLAEEQICIPWQEICSLALRYNQATPEVLLIEQLLPMSDEIAFAVYCTAQAQFPSFRSRQGSWDSTRIPASMLRDLNMFQAYLWLSMLHQNLSPFTMRLLPLCLMVFPSVNISWEFIDQTLRLLVAEIRSRLTEEQWLLVQPYTSGLIEIFALENAQF